MDWTRMLAYITGTVEQELLLRNEYLVAENRILKDQLKTPLRLTDAERTTLAEIAHRLGRKALEDIAKTAKPDTIMGWYRKLIARKFDGSKARRYPGRPRIEPELEALVVRMAKENIDWGYDRIVGVLANLGYILSDETVETSCGAMVSRRHRHENTPRPGKTLSVRIWTCSPGLTFLPWKCSHCAA
jgi:putative transposase